jgi:hypothetical protein
MRRTYISPEYLNKKVYGTYNMVEESNFFNAKMLDIEDSISIDTQSIVYFQKQTGEQIDFSIESTLPSLVYSASDNKSLNHTLERDPSQNEYDLNNNTRWILTVDLKSILTDFLFATMKRWRTFEGVQNNMTIENNVNIALTKYIQRNVLDRYKLKSFNLYVSYRNLRGQNVLRYKNEWKTTAVVDSNLLKRIQTETAFDESSIKVFFAQEKKSQEFAYDYYFNLLFEKL